MSCCTITFRGSSAFFVGCLLHLLAVAGSGCGSEEQFAAAELRVSRSAAHSLSTENRLSLNALSPRALSLRRLALDGLQPDGMERTVKGHELLKYLAQCALLEGAALQVAVDGEMHAHPGLFGLAPDWEHIPLGQRELGAVSGCLMAHVNRYGVSVDISVRQDGLVNTTAAEQRDFTRHEGAFFGSVFSDPQVMYSCTGDPRPDFTYNSCRPRSEHGDRLLRRCTDDQCAFIDVGPCSSVCESESDDGYDKCRDPSSPQGDHYAGVTNVWLLPHDSSRSVWPNHYATFFSRGCR